MQGLAYTTDNEPDLQIYLNWVQQWTNKNMQVRPYAEAEVTPAGGWTVTFSKPLYVPYGGIMVIGGGDSTTANPAILEIRSGSDVIDTLTITATPENWYEFKKSYSQISSSWYSPESFRNVILCAFTPLA